MRSSRDLIVIDRFLGILRCICVLDISKEDTLWYTDMIIQIANEMNRGV